jgi:hypothetical protein
VVIFVVFRTITAIRDTKKIAQTPDGRRRLWKQSVAGLAVLLLAGVAAIIWHYWGDEITILLPAIGATILIFIVFLVWLVLYGGGVFPPAPMSC